MGDKHGGEGFIFEANPEFADLIPGYLEKRRRDTDRMTAAFAQGDFASIAKIGHKIRGSAGGYGFDALADIARSLERGAKAEESAAVKDDLRRIVDCLTRVQVRYRVPAGKPLICIIDDDEDVRVVMERVLSLNGYRTVTAKDSASGEAAIRRERPDLILLDVMMPQMNGYDFCAKLQQDAEFASIPVVFMTALEGEQDKAKAFTSGAADYLTKSSDRKKILAAVARHLQAKSRWEKLANEPGSLSKRRIIPELEKFKTFLLAETDSPVKDEGLEGTTTDELYAAAPKLGVSRERIARLIAGFLELEYVRQINPESIKLGVLPTPFCLSHKLIAIEHPSGGTAFVLGDPFQHQLRDHLHQLFGRKEKILFLITEPEHISALLKRRSRDDVSRIIRTGIESIPIPEMGTHILEAAAYERASDIHIEPKEDKSLVRFRIDGDMRTIYSIKNETSLQLISRFKALADMDVAERRRPQDGSMNAAIDGRSFVLRLSTTCTPNGESLVLRLLEPWGKAMSLAELGMTETQVGHMMSFSQRNQGLLLIAGPTGSGKTTTVYSLLQHIDCTKRSLISIEDPVEYRIPTANQQQVDEKAGMTFESLLKSAVRQDPDILFLGEMRDQQSSKMSVDFASTGHLTLSTVHTANATTAIFRLERIGISRGAMADCILGVIAQKLVKRLCPHCKKTEPITREEREMFSPFTDDIPSRVAHPIGCEKCRQSGFWGREGVYEIVKFYPEISEMIRGGAPISQIRDFAQERGDYLLGQHAIEKVRDLVFSPRDVYESVLLEEAEYRRKAPVPAKDAPAPKLQHRGSDTIGKPRGGAAVLVVEDDEETQVLIERVLKSSGYLVTLAADGVEALMELGKTNFDLILSDIEMPNLDGLKLMELMESKGISTPVVLLTALTGAEDELKGLKLGAADYIKKPVSKEILLLRVARVLKSRGS